MRIDLPQCNFKACRYAFDGNCTNKNRYEICEYQLDKAEVERLSAEIADREQSHMNLYNEMRSYKDQVRILQNCDKHSLEAYESLLYEADYLIQKAKVDVVKEFAEKLKEYKCSYDLDNYHSFEAVEIDVIDDVVKELIGEEDDR